MEIKLTPWEIKGDIDYTKVLHDFGISLLKPLPEIFNEQILFRRKIIFAHRDFQQILESIKTKKKFVMMTGLMPTGKFHFGHLFLVQQFIFYQKLGAKLYIAIADLEAYNARNQSIEESRKNAIEDYLTNYIALGLEPKNVDIYFQSDRSQNAKKSNAYYRLQNVLARYATFNEFKSIYGDISPGKMIASLLQASDMLHPQLPEFENFCPIVVPVGIDQDPHIRLARDIANRIKHIPFIQLSSTYHEYLPGLKGPKSKMSSSDPSSFIALTDDQKTVKNKINKYAFSGGQPTLEEHRKKGGNPEMDVCYLYLKMFAENDDKKLTEIYNSYKKGILSTGELKKYTIEKINAFLVDHQKKIEKAKKRIKDFL